MLRVHNPTCDHLSTSDTPLKLRPKNTSEIQTRNTGVNSTHTLLKAVLLGMENLWFVTDLIKAELYIHAGGRNIYRAGTNIWDIPHQ